MVEQKLTLPEKLIPVKNVNQITDLCSTTDITIVNVLDMSSKY